MISCEYCQIFKDSFFCRGPSVAASTDDLGAKEISRQNSQPLFSQRLLEKWSFPLRISSVNATIFAVICSKLTITTPKTSFFEQRKYMQQRHTPNSKNKFTQRHVTLILQYCVWKLTSQLFVLKVYLQKDPCLFLTCFFMFLAYQSK